MLIIKFSIYFCKQITFNILISLNTFYLLCLEIGFANFMHRNFFIERIFWWRILDYCMGIHYVSFAELDLGHVFCKDCWSSWKKLKLSIEFHGNFSFLRFCRQFSIFLNRDHPLRDSENMDTHRIWTPLKMVDFWRISLLQGSQNCTRISHKMWLNL